MIGIFLDTETNGLDFYQNKILEIAFCLVNLETNDLLLEYSTCIHHTKEIFEKSDPQSLYINGFTYDLLETGKEEKLVKEEIKSIFHQFKIRRNNSVFICQNPSFDRSFFTQLIPIHEQEKMNLPYHWLDLASMFFALEKFHGGKPWSIGFSKDKIAKNMQIKEEKRPHRAINGVLHLLDCYKQLFIHYPLNGNNANS
jgi:DNA polymerase-3 subunit epsilon/oligoribonuclease